MARLHFSRFLLECDGCHQRHGEPHGHNSPQEARIAAYIDGWRFPVNLKANGSPGTSEADVCPSCLPAWTLKKRRSASRRLRASEAPQSQE